MTWKRIRRCFGAATAMACVLFVAAVASAQPGGMSGQMSPGGRGPTAGPGMASGPIWQGLVMRMDLTDEQRTQVKALLDEQRESGRAQHEETRKLQQQLATAIFGDGADVSIPDVVQRLADLNRQGLEADVALQQKVAALLTDAQRSRLLAFLSQGPPRGGPPMQER